MGRTRIPLKTKIIKARERLIKLSNELRTCEENIIKAKSLIATEEEKIKYFTRLKDQTRRLLAK